MNKKTRNRTTSQTYDPAAIRDIFGSNLKKLSDRYPSVASVCRDIGINRTQFNRYLSGESFPRPDILQQICGFFGVDARILLEPIEEIAPHSVEMINHAYLEGFFGQNATSVPEAVFPSGFYRFMRRSFVSDDQIAIGLVRVVRRDGYTFLRGFEPRNAIRGQGLSVAPENREYRGIVLQQEEGVMAVVSHRASLACSFNFLAPETSFQSNLWEGYATRTVREKINGRRAERMVYEHIGNDFGLALQTARQSSLVSPEKVPPFQRRLLRLGEDFR